MNVTKGAQDFMYREFSFLVSGFHFLIFIFTFIIFPSFLLVIPNLSLLSFVSSSFSPSSSPSSTFQLLLVLHIVVSNSLAISHSIHSIKSFFYTCCFIHGSHRARCFANVHLSFLGSQYW
ncbi:hypothetical protein GQ44DRAFT_814551 [Phaeosphaeriaceae sp. PMI808]|nr:hypothetical protein GQ44DRAFT_814551 [Phaeosphaeriaceae sp. PMI808]